MKYYQDKEEERFVYALFEPVVCGGSGHVLLWGSKVNFTGLPWQCEGVLATTQDPSLYREVPEEEMRSLCPRLVEHVQLPSLEKLLGWGQAHPPDIPVGTADGPTSCLLIAVGILDRKGGAWSLHEHSIDLCLPWGAGEEVRLAYTLPQAYHALIRALAPSRSSNGSQEREVLAGEFCHRVWALLHVRRTGQPYFVADQRGSVLILEDESVRLPPVQESSLPAYLLTADRGRVEGWVSALEQTTMHGFDLALFETEGEFLVIGRYKRDRTPKCGDVVVDDRQLYTLLYDTGDPFPSPQAAWSYTSNFLTPADVPDLIARFGNEPGDP
jgi:hypothetical protein